ncbi:MAG: hypothetical protein P1U67_02885 [Alcanivoracaceae bacterium]|nr:hypothetical protein [Alcanivoracaceae bacterium]
MQFKINHSDLKLLVDALEDSDQVMKLKNAEQHFEKGKYPTGRYVVDLSNDETESIIDTLSDFLMNSGLDENGEPNVLGLQIEALIDIFNDS